MARISRLVFGLALLCLPAGARAAPLELYGKLPSIEQGVISESGNELALIVTNGEERRIVVKDLNSGKYLFLAGLGTAKIRDIRFAGDHHILVTHSLATKPDMSEVEADFSEWYFTADLNLDTRKLNPLLTDATDSMNNVADLPTVRMVDGRPVVFLQGVHFTTSVGTRALFRVELDRDTSKLVTGGTPETADYVIGPDGKLLGQVYYESRSGRWSLRIDDGAAWHDALVRNEPIDTPDILGLSRDGKSVVVSYDDSGWHEVGAAGVSAASPIASVDGQTAILDPATDRLIGHTELVGDVQRWTFFDPADDRVWKAVQAAFPGERLTLESWSSDRNRILVRADSPTKGPAYALIDIKARSAKWLGDEYEGLTEADVSPVQAIKYKAADGFQLSGYLTLPKGKAAKNLPLVVFPHGGPAARDEPGFDWWPQGMASRGYAVLQVNFRGSAGFGWDYMKAGFGEWGRKMQTDLSDGVRYLASQGVIDPKRVCIVGASYGGYAALAGATLDKGVYRCAVSFGGVSDLRGLAVYGREHHGADAMRYWDRFMGAKDVHDPVLARYSPVQQAASADIPVLLIHGKDDTVVPPAQSVAMADALKRAGKPVELLMLDHADHWVSSGATRLQTLQATVAFLEKNNPPN